MDNRHFNRHFYTSEFSGVKKYFCRICHWSTTDLRAMRSHVIEHHKQPVKCLYPRCNFATQSQVKLYDHSRVHAGPMTTSNRSELPPATLVMDQVADYTQCEACGHQSENMEEASRHQGIHNSYRNLVSVANYRNRRYNALLRQQQEMQQQQPTVSSPRRRPRPPRIRTVLPRSGSREQEAASALSSLSQSSLDNEQDDAASILNFMYQQTGKGKKQYYGKRSSVMVKIPKRVKKWAAYAFKLKKLGFKGATETGWRRCRQLMTKDSIPIEDLRYMRNWYARHIYTSYPGFKAWQKAGRPKDSGWHNKHAILSWLTWGGSAGFNWINSKKIVRLLNKHFDTSYKPIRTSSLK